MVFFYPKCCSKARLDGKTAVITGCSRGIGKYTALDLCRRGCRVVMACIEKGEDAKNEIYNEIKNKPKIGSLEVKKLDLSSFRSVQECAHQILCEESKIDILINNAGVISSFELSEDGFEKTFAINYLGHFLFTLLLLPRIMDSENARIVNVGSSTYTIAQKNFKDINYDNHTFRRLKAYSRSKLAVLLFTKELSRRLKGKNVNVYSAHPGIVKTEILNGLVNNNTIWKLVGLIIGTPKQGAQTIIHCAVDEKVAHKSGYYYVDCKIKEMSRTAKDPELAKKLWDLSVNWVGLQKFDPFDSKHRGQD